LVFSRRMTVWKEKEKREPKSNYLVESSSVFQWWLCWSNGQAHAMPNKWDALEIKRCAQTHRRGRRRTAKMVDQKKSLVELEADQFVHTKHRSVHYLFTLFSLTLCLILKVGKPKRAFKFKTRSLQRQNHSDAGEEWSPARKRQIELACKWQLARERTSNQKRKSCNLKRPF